MLLARVGGESLQGTLELEATVIETIPRKSSIHKTDGNTPRITLPTRDSRSKFSNQPPPYWRTRRVTEREKTAEAQLSVEHDARK